MFAMNTGIVSGSAELPAVFGYFSENKKTSFLAQNVAKRAVFVDMCNDDIPTLIIVLDGLARIIQNTELDEHTCHAANLVIRWDKQILDIWHKDTPQDKVELGHYGMREDPRGEVVMIIKRLREVLSTYMLTLNGAAEESYLKDLLQKRNEELNPNGKFCVFSTSRMAACEFIAVNLWFNDAGGKNTVHITIGNIFEIFSKCVTRNDTFLDELVECFKALNDKASKLVKNLDDGSYFRHDFKNERMILSFHTNIWYSGKDEVPLYNALLVGQTFNNASRISFTANPCHLDFFVEEIGKIKARLMADK